MADYRNGKAHEKNIVPKGRYVVVNSKFVSTSGQIRKYVNEPLDLLTAGELAFVLSDVPNGRALSKTYLIQENDRYTLNQRIAGINPHQNVNSFFLQSLMNRNHYFLRFDDGVGQTNLSKADVENFSGYYPDFTEQVQIGNFLNEFNRTIALHQENKV